MPREKLFLLVGFGVAFMACAAIFYHYKQFEVKKEKEIRRKLASVPKEKEASVLVTTQEIPKGVEITNEMVEIKKMAAEAAQPGSVRSFDRIKGMVTVIPIEKGEQLTLNKLSYPSRGSELSDVTPAGKRAVTIAVDNLGALVGLIKPGNYVDVFAMIGVPVQGADQKMSAQLAVVPVFQNVLVLGVGRVVGAPSPVAAASQSSKGRSSRGTPGDEEAAMSTRANAAQMITLALSPQEASIMAFVQEQGKIRILMRSPADTKIEPLQPANWDTFFRHIMPYAVKDSQQPDGVIEVYRGLNKENIPVYKNK